MNIRLQQENIDRCRFCFMCRHVCTLGRVTSEEALTPRSQALSLSLILRGAVEYTEELVENLYQCCLCGYCKDWCQGGWDFPAAVKAARADIVEQGLVPAGVAALKDELLENGNAYGKAAMDVALKQEIEKHREKQELGVIFGSDVLYAAPEIGLSLMRILDAAGVRFMAFPEEDTSCYELYCLGYRKEARELASQLIDRVRVVGCRQVIVASPDFEAFLSKEVPVLGLEWGETTLVGAVKYVHGLLQNKRLTLKKSYEKNMTYHDPNGLARETGVTVEPREILTNLSGREYLEMVWNKNEAHSAGSNLVSRLYPKLGQDILQKRVEDVREIDAETLVTASPFDKLSFSQALAGQKAVVDILQLVSDLI